MEKSMSILFIGYGSHLQMSYYKHSQQTMHLNEKKVDQEMKANLVLKFNINDLQNIKRNKKAYILRIKFIKEIIELKEFTFDEKK